MFALAILIGIYSYVIFALGLLGFFYKLPLFITTVIFISLSLFFFKSHKNELPRFSLKNKKIKPLLFLFGILATVNLIGVLGPELSFDALWYHLTLPKIFLLNHTITYLPGGVFYYSVMPKLGEMLYILPVSFGFETMAKLIQWGFGILTSFAVFKISRKYFDEKTSFFAVLIFYGNIVVAWESTVAYVDLIRAFFEAMALWGFLNWLETKDRKWIIESAVMLGFAISTKLIAIGSLLIFTLLIAYVLSKINKPKEVVTGILVYSCVVLFVALPWFVFAYLTTGNPFYPVFSKAYSLGFDTSLLNPINIAKDLLVVFLRAADPISPIYAIILPLVFMMFGKFDKKQRILSIYCLLALIVWYFTPRTGGGRFILPYLGAFSILSVALIEQVKSVWLKKYLLSIILFVFISTIFYRVIANSRFIPIILGVEPKQEFMAKKLNFNYDDFYDIDGFFKRNIKPSDKVLLYGFHNLYYADFPFVHNSYARKGERFNYIATQDSTLPKRFSNWNLIYINELTHVKVYSLGGVMWSY